MPENKLKRIGILRGGTAENYESSLSQGGDIISYIYDNLSERWIPVDILVDRDYIWHMNGLPVNPGDLQHRVDVVWNASHPTFSNILEGLSIPSVGTSAFASSLQNSRDMLREHMKQIGVSTSRHIVLPVYQGDFDGPLDKYATKAAKTVFEKFNSPWIVKSLTPDRTIGIHIANTFPELIHAIEDAVAHEKSILVEEYIGDKVASVHSVAGFRGEDIYTFPFGDSSDNFSSDEKEKLTSLARQLHNHIDARHYLKSDFALNKRNKIYLLSIESMPDLKSDSHFSDACVSAGTEMQNVIEHILEQALN